MLVLLPEDERFIFRFGACHCFRTKRQQNSLVNYGFHKFCNKHINNPTQSTKHVKPALDYAVNTIDLEEDFLEDYKIELEYGDSKCSKDAKLTACDMYYNNLQKGKHSYWRGHNTHPPLVHRGGISL